MRLISRVEINYYRSLHKATLSPLGDLNLVFGRNDAGKSNVLRALNLFFNDQPSPNVDLDFNLDLSGIRRREVETSKGRQFLSIRVVFSIPENFRKSLGETFSVKRQWNRYGDRTEITPDLSGGQRIQLTKFLNQIDFTYIPAIKDAELYSDLVERLYSAIAESSGIVQATEGFIGSIRDQTDELSQELSKLFGSSTKLSAPSDMGSLFRSLDFAHGEDQHSLLKQKGDGVKARHIPELLAYINRKETGKKFFLWGFEEPENSLDLQSADAEAQSLAVRSAQTDTQIFCTSHSPAFYLAGDISETSERTQRFFITKQIKDEGKLEPTNAVLRIGSFEQAESVMQEASLLQLPYLIRRWAELKAENKKLDDEATTLRQKLDGLSTPAIFVEGVHDKYLFRHALSDLAGEDNVQLETLDGTPKGASEYLARLRASKISASAKAVSFLFDNDPPGRAAYSVLSKSKTPGEAPISVAPGLHAWCLPTTDEWDSFRQAHNILPEQGIFEAEFLFPGADAAQLLLGLLSDEELTDYNAVIHNDYNRCLSQKAANELRSAAPGSREWMWGRGVPDSKKRAFNQSAVVTLDMSAAQSVMMKLMAVS